MTGITAADFMPAIAEIWLMVMACVTLMAGLFSDKDSPVTYLLAQLTLVGAVFLSWIAYLHWGGVGHRAVLIFHQQFVLDQLSTLLKLFIYLVMFLVFLYARQYNKDHRIPTHEFHALGLLSTLGMMVMVSAHNLLPLYLGMELFSLPIYAMVALERREGRCIEAAMKYFVIGAMSSGLLLYGLSLIFGVTHSLDIGRIMLTAMHLSSMHQVLLLVALVFVLAGVGFKFGAAPFHLWVPDVYEGASTSITLLLSTAPKIAAFGLVIRLIVEGLPLHVADQDLFIAVAILSMFIGNFAAIMQTNIKRLLAYSSIAHIGYMFVGLACMTPRGDAAALFYILTYALTAVAAFGMLTIMSRAGFEVNDIADLSGLNARSPWLAFMMLITLFSMAGLPPLVGFIAKLGLLEALINVHLVWLAILMLAFAIVASFYYLRVVRVIYFDAPRATTKMTCALDSQIIMSLNGLAILCLGLFPGALFAMCHAAFYSW